MNAEIDVGAKEYFIFPFFTSLLTAESRHAVKIQRYTCCWRTVLNSAAATRPIPCCITCAGAPPSLRYVTRQCDRGLAKRPATAAGDERCVECRLRSVRGLKSKPELRGWNRL